MDEKPRRGRPAKTEGGGSREMLIERTLTALRATPSLDIQRQALADAAKVTPALVSYYFPDKWVLVYLAVSPVVAQYGSALKKIAAETEPGLESLRALLTLYAQFNLDDSMILDFYIASLRRTNRTEEFDAFEAIYASVIALLVRLMDAGLLRRANPVQVQSSMWGLSRYFAQQCRTIPGLLSGGYSADAEGIASLVFDMIFNGAATRPDGSGAKPRSAAVAGDRENA